MLQVPDRDWAADVARLRAEIASLKMHVAAQRLLRALRREELLTAKYRPDQPRVPVGNSDGGRWTSEGAGSAGLGSDGTLAGRPGRDGDAAQLAFAPIAGEKAAEAALALYLLWASRNSQETTAALEFRAQEFMPGAAKTDPAIGVRNLTREEVDEACPKHGLVQDITNEAADLVTEEENYWTPTQYGTKVHDAIKTNIKNLYDPNLLAEVSYIKSIEAGYGKKGSVRIDVLENVGDGNVCVYDIKTGKSELTPARMHEIATNVHSHFMGTKKILVIETRPK